MRHSKSSDEHRNECEILQAVLLAQSMQQLAVGYLSLFKATNPEKFVRGVCILIFQAEGKGHRIDI